MTPQPNQFVIIYFRNGLHLEGIVVSWSDQKSVIKSTNGTFHTVIQKTLEDVLFVKITDAPNAYEKIKEQPRKDFDDIKTLASLKDDLREIEKEEIREKLTSHETSGIQQVNYGLPRNIQIRSAELDPKEKITGTNSSISKELQNLFNKKY